MSEKFYDLWLSEQQVNHIISLLEEHSRTCLAAKGDYSRDLKQQIEFSVSQQTTLD